MFSVDSVKPLDASFVAEVDGVNQDQWSALVGEFADANIYQTWSYGVARSGSSNLSHLVLKQDGRIVAAVQARLAGLFNLRLGVVYIRWGPLWKLRNDEVNYEVFRQIVRAIRNEYTLRKGLVVRLLPALAICVDENELYGRILEEEGFELKHTEHYRTILMDIRPSLDELERGFHQKWRKHLNRARKNDLEIIEGEDDSLLEALGKVYKEMLDRKQFSGSTDISIYRNTQETLPLGQRMISVLCKEGEEIVAGALFSTLGDTGLDLFRATSNRGVKNYGSYLVQWRVLEILKRCGCVEYNLNGINPTRNPGGYQFKSQLAGKNGGEVCFLGSFDSYPNPILRLLVAAGEQFKAGFRWRRRNPVPEDTNDRC